jgi:hypothetical protein
VLWNVNGVPGGNATLGQICVAASIPCQQVLNASSSPVDYVAPGAIPAPNPVTVEAVSAADATKNAIAQITVINHILVAVLPASVTLSPEAVQSFSATVLGSANQNVVWQISGTGCNSGSGVCGAIDANGTYTAPAAAPSPNAIQVIAVSEDDTTQSGTATVTISTGVNLLSLHPASVYAGGLQGFTLRVDGSGFVPAGASAGSTLLIAGTARPTACTSAAECNAPVLPTDVSTTGTVLVQMRNPDATQSNVLNLVVAPPNISDATISLTSAAPDATGQDIVAVEPTTAGISSPNDDVDIDVGALGAFSTATNSCTLAGNSVTLHPLFRTRILNFLFRVSSARRAWLHFRSGGSRCAPAGGAFRRLSVSRARASTHSSRQLRRAVEHYAQRQPRHHHYAGPERQRTIDRS